MTTGLFISFEGSEGSGKTTQIQRLAARLEKCDRKVVTTREPGGTPIGEHIRNLLKFEQCAQAMCPETELLLFAASRAQLVRELIEPSVKAGNIVLCDRYLDSTTVYQGVARQISADPVQMINRFAVGDLVPDLTVVLDVSVETSLARIKHRGSTTPDRLEQENIDFYNRVREGYLLLAKSLTERFIVVDGTQSEEAVAQTLWEHLCVRFGLSEPQSP